MRPLFILGEIGGGLRRNTSLFVSVVLVTMVSVFFLGSSLLAQRQVETAKGYWYDRVQASVFLCTDISARSVPSCSSGAVTDEQREAVRTRLGALSTQVTEVMHESQGEAYQRFREQFRNSPVVDRVPQSAIPESFRLRLSSPDDAETVRQTVAGMPGVDSVQDPSEALGKLFTFLNGVSLSALAMAGVMLVCAVLLMSTTIRQTAWSRRREIGIMRLVGASNATINTPFVLQTALAAVVGAALAVLLLWGMVHYWVGGFLTEAFARSSPVSLIGVADVWRIAPWLALGALGLACVTSWLALRRHVRV